MWTRRAVVAGGLVVVLIVAVGLGGYFYAGYQFHRIPKVRVNDLKKQKPGAPFTVLVAGSDSRSFVNTPGQCKSFGCGADVGGARSDVVILVRVVPAERKIEMLSIPRDTWVTIPGNVQYISGQNRINAAFNTGNPSLLVATLMQNFHIPVNYFVEVNFLGRPARISALPALLAARADAQVVTASTVTTEDGHHEITFGRPRVLSGFPDRRAAGRDLLQMCSTELGDAIRRTAYHWHVPADVRQLPWSGGLLH